MGVVRCPKPRLLITITIMEEVSDFNLVEGKMDLIMSDIVLLSKKEKAPENYVAVRGDDG